MKQIDFGNSKYEYKEELESFVSSINDTMQKYEKSFNNADAGLKKIEASIVKKNAELDKLSADLEELNLRKEELSNLKDTSNAMIKDLEEKKKNTVYSDSEVQKMEIDDLDTLITARKNKIAKIDAKISTTKEKIKTNGENRKVSEGDLKALEAEKRTSEENLYRTNAILDLIKNTKDEFNSGIKSILESAYVSIEEQTPIEPVETKEAEKPSEEISSEELVIDDDFDVTDLDTQDETEEEINIEEPTVDLTPLKSIEPEEEIPEDDRRSILDFDVNDIDIPMEEEAAVEEPTSEEGEEKSSNYEDLLEDVFHKEAISFSDFKESVREKMLANADRVIKNVVVLKKHQIPLELTIEQSDIYTDIEPQDLDDLMNIITTDEDGNGMGFTIDYTYYILNELAKINVDKLIDVYNNEFMNVNAKSGIIWLLKLTEPTLTEFKANRKANIDTLKSLGVEAADDIASEYPEFIDMDNPLFTNALNLFDKDDLVDKLNTDINVVPKILEYWQNN